MVAMTVAIVALLLAVVVAVVVRATWRQADDGRHSVRDYRQTLDTLRAMTDRRSAEVRLDPVVRESATRRVQARRPVRSTGERRPSQTGPQGTAAAPRDVPSASANQSHGAGGAPLRRTGPPARAARAPARPPSRPAVSRRPPSGRAGAEAGARRPGDAAPGAGIPAVHVGGDQGAGESEAGGAATARQDVEVTGVGAEPVAVFDDTAAPAAAGEGLLAAPGRSGGWARAARRGGARHARRFGPGGGGRHVLQVAGVAAAAAAVAVLALVVGHGATADHGATAGSARTSATGALANRRAHHPPASPTSTVPPEVQPAVATLYHATVPAPSSTYNVLVSVTGLCWMAERTPGGSMLWSGLLHAGEQHSFSVVGPVELEIGAADASVTLDGVPVALPAGYQAPYVVTFQPA